MICEVRTDELHMDYFFGFFICITIFSRISWTESLTTSVNVAPTEDFEQTRQVGSNVTITPSAEFSDVANSHEHSNGSRGSVQCSSRPENVSTVVELLNDTELLKLINPTANVTRQKPAPCVLVLFYSTLCTFSSLAAPHFNALPRVFPDVRMVAINSHTYHLFNTQNGILGVPTLMLIHNGIPVARYNQSDYHLELFSQFLTKWTQLAPQKNSVVTSADFAGPVISQPAQHNDVFLIMAWLFVISCTIYYFTKSSYWIWLKETVESNWRDSEAQAHLHLD